MSVNTIRGFTLIEFMIVLGIAAFMITLGIPGFNNFLNNSRATTQINEMVSAIHLARSEAVKRSARVTMCKSIDNASCSNTKGWEQGWIVFVDTNANSAFDSGEQLLLSNDGLEGDTTVMGSSGSVINNYISYRSNGTTTFAAVNGDQELLLCDQRKDASKTKAITVSPLGRVKTINGSDSTLSCA